MEVRMNFVAKVAMLVLLLCFCTGAEAHDLPGKSAEYQKWAKEAQTLPEARKTFPSPWNYCCNHAEVIPVKDIIFPTQEHGWQWNDNGTIRDIPNIIIHWHDSAPGNQPTLFVYQNTMTCFFPPQGGV